MTKDDLARLLAPHLPSSPVVITSGPLLGLGDHAVWTTLPQRFAELGYEVYLDQDVATSNPEIYDLFYRRNPHFAGLTNIKPNAGYVNQGLFYELANRLPGCRSIEAMERAHGLPPPYSLAPRIYYEPQPHHLDLRETVLVDFSAVSSQLGVKALGEAMKMMAGRFRNAPFLQVIHPRHVVLHTPMVCAQGYEVESIYEYLDMLAAARAWIGSEAGGQSLAAAVRGEHEVYDEDARPEVVVTSTPPTYNSRGYTYRGVDYRVAPPGVQDPSYFQPVEIDVLKYTNTCLARRAEFASRTP